MSKLIEQVNSLTVPQGMLALWGLGQSGFIIKGGDTIVYIDPYLTNYVEEAGFGPKGLFEREFEPPLKPEDATNAQIVFLTHEHADHTDPLTVGPIGKASPKAQFVGTPYSRDIAAGVGVAAERFVVPVAEKPQTIGNVKFTALPSAHYGLDYDAEKGYRWLGFVIEMNGVTLYHAGDTLIYDGYVDMLKRYPMDVAILPVNGRDWWREQKGLLGNFDPHEAAHLVNELKVDVLIPVHNDLFAGNRLRPGIMADAMDRTAPRQKYHWIQPGELYYYVKGAQ